MVYTGAQLAALEAAKLDRETYLGAAKTKYLLDLKVF